MLLYHCLIYTNEVLISSGILVIFIMAFFDNLVYDKGGKYYEKGGLFMDKLIKKISEIEAAAASVMEEMNEQKASFTAEIHKKTASFDQELEKSTAEEIQQLNLSMEEDLRQQLARQESEGEALLSRLEQAYEENHTILAANLFQEMIKE